MQIELAEHMMEGLLSLDGMDSTIIMFALHEQRQPEVLPCGQVG